MPNYPIRVGFCAPSRAVMDISTPALAKLYFTDRGADVVLHDTVFKNVKQFAGTDAERVDGLMSLACNKDIDLILPIRGGYGLSRILDKIDYDAIARHSPVFADIQILRLLILPTLPKQVRSVIKAPMVRILSTRRHF